MSKLCKLAEPHLKGYKLYKDVLIAWIAIIVNV